MDNSILGCKKSNNTFDNSVVQNLDINRYLGRWYEIARFDHKFERGTCRSNRRLLIKEGWKKLKLSTAAIIIL